MSCPSRRISRSILQACLPEKGKKDRIMMDFAAIDFETATARRDSACSVAVVEWKDGKPVDSYDTLIQPPGNVYHWFNTKIHGIRPEDTADAPDFAAIWPELSAHLAGRLVVAHNARFDMGVLAACLARQGLQAPQFSYCDTVAIARKAWPELENHKLDTVGRFLHLRFHHHDALEDARVCAAIPVFVGRAIGTEDFGTLVRNLGVRVQPFGRR